jgi:type VI secretion system secreted protein Hcp
MTTTFIKFDGIPGESTARAHKDEIDVISWWWGVTVTAVGGTGRRRGRPQPQALVFVHKYDKASPKLAKAAIAGVRTRTVVLSSQVDGAVPRNFLTITLSDVAVTSIQTRDDGTGPLEEVAVSYGSIKMAYVPLANDGSSGASVQVDWDTRTGRVV